MKSVENTGYRPLRRPPGANRGKSIQPAGAKDVRAARAAARSVADLRPQVRAPKPRGWPAREKRLALYCLSLAFDCASLGLGYVAALSLRDADWLDTAGQPLLLIALPIFLLLEIAREVQGVEALESRSLATQRGLGALLGTALIVLALSFLFKSQDVSRVGFMTLFGVAAITLTLGKVILDLIFVHWMGGVAVATIVLQDGLAAQKHADCDVVDVQRLGLWPDLNAPSSIDALSRIISAYDRVVVACCFERRSAWATFLKSQDVGGEILLDRDLLHGAVAIGTYGADDTLVLSRGPLALSSRIQKRIFDIVVSAALLALASPILLIVAVTLKIEGPGPVLFRQRRVGLGNRQFTILKFRSMRQDRGDAEGRRSASRDDERITPVGRLLRRTSIDELPQLINVLRGEMSIVGPRPHALGSLAGDRLFWEVTDGYWVRHSLKPGLTGLAQVRGLRGATHSQDDIRQRVRSDLEYLMTWSIWLDVLILLRTFRVIVHQNAF